MDGRFPISRIFVIPYSPFVPPYNSHACFFPYYPYLSSDTHIDISFLLWGPWSMLRVVGRQLSLCISVARLALRLVGLRRWGSECRFPSLSGLRSHMAIQGLRQQCLSLVMEQEQLI